MKSLAVLGRCVAIIVVTAICSVIPAGALSGEPYRLNEGSGILSIIGNGRPPATVQSTAQARLLAERAAIVDAYGAAVRLLSETIPMAVSGQGEYSVSFRGGTIRRSDVASDGTVRVELELPIQPEIAGTIREVMRGWEVPKTPAIERAGIGHEDFVAIHRVQGPRRITLREWNDRYRTGAWRSVAQ